ncbi:hypothetical protein ACOTET_25220, partial [Achromobacter xylosoxidans]
NTAIDWPAANTTMRAENDRAMAREVEAAVLRKLSKLRAPVTDAGNWQQYRLRGSDENAEQVIERERRAYADLLQSVMDKRRDQASAPVAGEAVAHAVIAYGRIQRIVANEESAHEHAEQHSLNAEAAGWNAKAHVRPLVYGDAAPQAGAEDVRNAALEEAAVLVGGHTWAGASKIVSDLIAEHIRALKT